MKTRVGTEARFSLQGGYKLKLNTFESINRLILDALLKKDTGSRAQNQNIQSNASDEHEFVQNSDKIQRYEEMSAQDDRYSAWLPPKNQTGDGRTNLNDKFGY